MYDLKDRLSIALYSGCRVVFLLWSMVNFSFMATIRQDAIGDWYLDEK